MTYTIIRTARCEPWCVRHALAEDGLTTFCSATDIPIVTRESGDASVGLSHFPDTPPTIDFLIGDSVPLTLFVDEAERIGKALLSQAARARGEVAAQ